MEKLGKNGRTRPVNGCVLVSTQVVEQSVDIDADLLVTDLAPTDMLLQRVGRLWRHERGKRPVERPEVWIRSPAMTLEQMKDVGVEKIKEALGKSAKVYAPYVLLRTLEEWDGLDVMRIPNGIRSLLEATYAERANEPEPWRNLRIELDKRKEKLRMSAMANSNPWQVQLEDEEGVQTRWQEMSSAYILPMTRVSAWDGKKGGCFSLLNGEKVDVKSGIFSYNAAKAIHRNLIKAPRWFLKDFINEARGLPWLAEYVHGEGVAIEIKPMLAP